MSTADDFPSSSGGPQNQDGTRSSARADELSLAAELNSQPAWHGGGRFTGRSVSAWPHALSQAPVWAASPLMLGVLTVAKPAERGFARLWRGVL